MFNKAEHCLESALICENLWIKQKYALAQPGAILELIAHDFFLFLQAIKVQMATSNIRIKNKKASFEYYLEERYVAGIQLTGTEIKSIRNGKAQLTESYCYFRNNELFIKNMHINEYELGTIYNHEPKRDRKLLLRKRELSKLKSKINEKGFTLIPLILFINEKGLAKLEIALAKGKHTYDKRSSLKEKDVKRDMDRAAE